MELHEALFLVGAVPAGMLVLLFGLLFGLPLLLFVVIWHGTGKLCEGIVKLFLLISKGFDLLSEKILEQDIHCCCAFYVDHIPPLRLLEFFIDAVVRTFTDRGRFPTLLHASVHDNESPFVWIKALILLAPQRLLTQDQQGQTPLHVFLNYQLHRVYPRGIEMMEYMIKHGPGSLQIADSDGLLPLHVAVKFGPSEIFKMLLEVYPPAVRVFASRVGLPLHLACMHNECLETIQLLVEAYPLALCERRPQSNQLPHQIMTMRSHPNQQYVEGRYNDLVRAEAFKVLEHHGCPRCVGFHMLDFISLMPIALSSAPPYNGSARLSD